MYSQSKGRQYLVGQHEDLLAFLLSVCPLHPGEDWEEDKKLNLILSKVQEHQQSLREPGSGSKSQFPDPNEYDLNNPYDPDDDGPIIFKGRFVRYHT